MEPGSLLFTNARIFDGSGRPPFQGEVLVEKNRIEAVSDSASRIGGQYAEVLDCGGRTLMPGLVEAHAHLSWPSSVGRIINRMMLPPEEHLLVTARNAKVTLDAGFTSAYSAGSLGPRFEIALRDEINGGWLPGPRLSASSLERLPARAHGQDPEEASRQRRAPSPGRICRWSYTTSTASSCLASSLPAYRLSQ
jgi:imidazolonepropionase-like amidohydrolase